MPVSAKQVARTQFNYGQWARGNASNARVRERRGKRRRRRQDAKERIQSESTGGGREEEVEGTCVVPGAQAERDLRRNLPGRDHAGKDKE